jgi:hypothetical protein
MATVLTLLIHINLRARNRDAKYAGNAQFGAISGLAGRGSV